MLKLQPWNVCKWLDGSLWKPLLPQEDPRQSLAHTNYMVDMRAWREAPTSFLKEVCMYYLGIWALGRT